MAVLDSGTLTNFTSGLLTMPANTKALVLVMSDDVALGSLAMTFNGDPLTEAVTATETASYSSIYHIFNPDIGEYTLNCVNSINKIQWYACDDLVALLDTDTDNIDTSPHNISLNIEGAASAFISSNSEFFHDGAFAVAGDWTDDISDAYRVLSIYNGSGGTPVSTNITNSGTLTRWATCGASYEIQTNPVLTAIQVQSTVNSPTISAISPRIPISSRVMNTLLSSGHLLDNHAPDKTETEINRLVDSAGGFLALPSTGARLWYPSDGVTIKTYEISSRRLNTALSSKKGRTT